MHVEAHSTVAGSRGLIGLRRKSARRMDAGEVMRASMLASGEVFTPLPTIHEGRIVGYTCGTPDGRAIWMPARDRQVAPWLAATTSYADIVSAVLKNQRHTVGFYKDWTTAGVANNWYDLWPVAALPEAGGYSGAANTAVAYTDQTAGKLWHGGDKTLTKNLLRLSVVNSNNACVYQLYDRVLGYEANAFTAGTSQAMTNAVSAPRYNGAGLSGMRAFLYCQTLFGATAANLTTMGYVSDQGVTHATPTTRTIAIIVSAAAPTSTLPARIVAPADSGGTVTWGKYLPLVAGDLGARSVVSYVTSAANTGTFGIILARPIATIITYAGEVAADIDFAMAKSGIERIYNGACLSLLVNSQSTTQTITGSMEVYWA